MLEEAIVATRPTESALMTLPPSHSWLSGIPSLTAWTCSRVEVTGSLVYAVQRWESVRVGGSRASGRIPPGGPKGHGGARLFPFLVAPVGVKDDPAVTMRCREPLRTLPRPWGRCGDRYEPCGARVSGVLVLGGVYLGQIGDNRRLERQQPG